MNKIEELKKQLEELRKSNEASWDMYGSELCAEDMIRSEKFLEKQINELIQMEKSNGHI